MRPFRPRFTVRALAIFVTLVCVYFGAWDATKTYGMRQFTSRHFMGFGQEKGGGPKQRVARYEQFENEYLLLATSEGIISCPMPFVLSIVDTVDDNGYWTSEKDPKRRYYIWLFGGSVKTPFHF